MAILNPAILALTLAALAVSLALLPAAVFSLRVLRQWDMDSGSERQLGLERSTYLISTLVAFAFAVELIALLLFIYNAEALSTQFVGAMCATGVLNVNGYGWPTLLLKVLIFFAAALWLQLNRLDNRGEDYPLTRRKYGLLLAIAPLVWAEAAVQTLFFLNMNPEVITSCCGSLFSAEGSGVAAEIAGLAPREAALLFFGGGLTVLGLGAWRLWRGRGGIPFALGGIGAFVTALMGIVSFVALYVYEHPHHHCPFCILKAGHGFIGYGLYIPLFAATALALGAGSAALHRHVPSLRAAAALEGLRSIRLAMIGFVWFYALGLWLVARSNLTLTEVWW
ncbi:MAG: hypothetical protein KJ558_02740 [Gammaproteobacteria bacterium]|nr:hypothetical protein [Gammaproteobacteria bacterium]MBU1653743.1 hypothetical protein [Gammaproteobacteria bacterium]MBU1959620.1 hypothetical protein [Gammaproteobacteria bacterium]